METESHRPTEPSPKGGKLVAVAFGILILMAVAIAAATFVEDKRGTERAHSLIYGSWWFRCGWAALAASGLIVIIKKRLWHRPAVFMLHLSFIVILAGALTTALTSRQGIIHLRQGFPTSAYLDKKRQVQKLPYLVRLDSFKVVFYPGTEAPQDYVSKVFCKGQQYTISMNHIMERDGYRFYQTSFDPDGQGSILSVTYDPWGTGLTYLGYAMLALSMMFVSLPRSLFCRLGRWKKEAATTLLLLMFCTSTHAGLPVIRREKADSIERQQVVWNDRPCPVGTMSRDILLKVYGATTYHGLTPTQVTASWTLAPKQWNSQPIIKVKRGQYACLNDFIDYSGPVPRFKAPDDDKLLEKLALLVMLQQGTLAKPLPKGMKPLSEKRVSIELFHNKVDWTFWGMIGSFAVFFIALAEQWRKHKKEALGFASTSEDTSHDHLVIQKCRTWFSSPSRALSIVLFLFLLTGWILRWYIAEHIPMSNGYESMLFVALCLTLVNIFLSSRSVGALMAGLTLVVAHIGAMNPQVTPLMPVLNSPWLSLHVSVIMTSYALLALSIIERRLLRPAVFMLAAGIFLGAVWANVSWGTYWSWDPKESWALITLLVYSLPLHTQSLPWLNSMRNYRIYSIIALACLLMTYFGVNFLLGGMHSYGAS